ncbi:MAG: AmmeMemoRadiSam system radical SAM enzyme [Spirochaetaceae bacterium]
MSDQTTQTKPVPRFYETREDGMLRCRLCPHNCVIAQGKTGFCRVRKNEAGEMTLPFYGHASALGLDPIEKKPLYHFYPGKPILSIGFLGCFMRCPFCQNYRISQSTVARTQYVSPEALIEEARQSGSFGVAYTYNEPAIHAEYVLDSAERATAVGLKNVLVTAGYLNEEPARRIYGAMDAANIDLKSFREEFYRRELRGGLDEVLRNIEIAHERCHVEVTTLVIPGKNDSEEEIRGIARFLAELDPDIPLHLSAYYPSYNYTTEPTSPEQLFSRVELAREHLRYVYAGNVPGRADTHCPSCGNLLIERSGYRTRIHGVREGRCTRCGEAVPVVGV